MPLQYFYKAMDVHGRVVYGQLGASNVSDLEARLARMGLDMIHYHIKKPRNRHIGQVTRQELITFCFHMETLTRAGVPLLDGLSDLRDSLPQSRFREVVSGIVDNIEGGERLSEAMANFPEAFDQVFISLIRAGEESGSLTMVFQHLTETLKWNDEMLAKTKKLFLYPAFMTSVIVGVFFFLMLYLVPQLVIFIKSIGVVLPFHTRALIFLSNLFTDYWYLVISVPILIFFAFTFLIKTSPDLRYWFDYFKLKVWIFGPILEKIILARFANFLALLYRSGITVLDGLQITKTMAGNQIIEQALQQVHDSIAEGTSISESFERTRLFPPLVLRMVKIGETTGDLDVALLNISYFYNREVKESIERLQTLIEPAMTVILGLLLGWVMISVLGTIYDIIAGLAGTGMSPRGGVDLK